LKNTVQPEFSKTGVLQRTAKRPQATPGFTMLEIAVVLGVITLLASLILPIIVKARASARVAQCTSNLRQLGQAMLMYDIDTERDYENYPDRLTYLAKFKYAVDERIFLCPNDSSKGIANTLKPGAPSDTKIQWAERQSHGNGELNSSYLYEFSTLYEYTYDAADTWTGSWPAMFLVYWEMGQAWSVESEPERVDRDSNGVITWQEVKLWQLNNADVYISGTSPPGVDGIPDGWSDEPYNMVDNIDIFPMQRYPRSWLPSVRCFWHCTPAMIDKADYLNGGPEEVLNLAVDGNVFYSVPGWEQTAWKFGRDAGIESW
jgi:type II secretory pathway pseudopilin PulG